ncbi:MAG: methyltransferase domain-containing protein [Desulfobacterales bacterium]|nr:methyltransferase domain-containing protein [Desulfobacterales bacterium]
MKTSTRHRLLQKAAACRRTALKCRGDGDAKGAAVAYRKQGRLLKACSEAGLAAEAYRRAVALDPSDALAQCGLGQVLAAMNRHEEAKARLEQAAVLAPENPRIRFLYDSVRGGSPPRAPRHYVANLFDRYAEHFESHLAELGYSLPKAFGRRIGRLSRKTGGFCRGIDLGCGTGLIGRWIRPSVNRLDGVDLSPKMIEIAASAGVYDKLALADIHDYCRSCSIKYDLFVAADVLIYIGDLDEMFEGVKSCSRQGGVFVFSVEERGNAGYTLQPSARYAHSRRYVCSRIKKHGMRLIGGSQVRIRREKDRWAHGRLYEAAL